MKKIAIFLMAVVVVFTAACKKDDKVSLKGIALDKTTMELAPGNKATLKVIYSPDNATNKEVVWSSSSPGVATVSSSGEVTGVAVGSADITVTAADGGHKATCKVTVLIPEVLVTGVKVEPVKLELVKGKTETLKETVEPSNATIKTVTWKSSDEKVATVVNGAVTAVDGGTATITVTTAQGNKTATCEVTVIVKVEKVELSAKTVSVVVGKDVTIKATVKPDNATNKKVSWSVDEDGEEFVEIEADDAKGELKITGLAEGTAIITVITEDGEFEETCEVKVVGAVAVTGVKLSFAEMDLPLGATSKWLIATVEPVGNETTPGATNKKVTWSSNSANVSVDPETGELTAKAKGPATITVTTDDGGKTATCEVTVLADPIELLTGGTSKTWTWDEQYGVNSCWGMGDARNQVAPTWWLPAGSGFNAATEWKGASMTFAKTGLTLVKNKIGGTTAEGTFKVELTEKHPNFARSLGQLQTENVTILRGLSVHDDKVEIYKTEIIRLTEKEMMLVWVHSKAGDVDDKGVVYISPDESGWAAGTIWHFKAGEAEQPPEIIYPDTPDDADVCGEDATVLWEERKEITWGDVVRVDASEFEDVPAGTIMTLHYRLQLPVVWAQAFICNAENWDKIVIDEFGTPDGKFVPTDHGAWDADRNKSFSFVLTQDLLDIFSVGGWLIQGENLMITKVTLCLP